MANFKYSEVITTSENLLNTLKEEITSFTEYPYDASKGETPVTNAWTVFDELTDTSGKIKELILKGVTTIGETNPLSKEFYLKFINEYFNNPAEHSTLKVQILDGYDNTLQDFTLKGHPVVYEWANEAYTPTDRNAKKPVYVYLNVSNNKLAMVLVADPAVNFNDYRKSFLYAGAIKPFKFNENDVVGNILLTAGAVSAEPTNPLNGYNFGVYTSFGNNTMQMLKTKSGIEFQKHYAAFITQAPPKGKAFVDSVLGDTGLELEKQGFQASRWTNKYHMSPVYVVHPYEGYRGSLDSVVALPKHNILHLDELIVDVENKPWRQEVYKYFDFDTERNFMNTSANIKMGIAFLKEIRY